MKRLWLLQLFLVLSEVSSKGVRKDKEKNPDVLKEFRSFADSVIPEEKSASRKISGKAHLSLVKDPAVYIDEPLRQVTRKVTFASTGHNTNDEVAKTVYPNGPSTQRDDTSKKQEGDDDEVDTYIDEKEEYKSDEKSSLAKKKHPARTKAEPSVQTAVNHGQPAVAITGRGQVQNESKPAGKSSNKSKHGDPKLSTASGVVHLNVNENEHHSTKSGDTLKDALKDALKVNKTKKESHLSNVYKPTKFYNSKADKNLLKNLLKGDKSTKVIPVDNNSTIQSARIGHNIKDDTRILKDKKMDEFSSNRGTPRPTKGHKTIKASNIKDHKFTKELNPTTTKDRTDSLKESEVNDVRNELQYIEKLKGGSAVSPEKKLTRVDGIKINLKKLEEKKRTNNSDQKYSTLKKAVQLNDTRIIHLRLRGRGDTKNGTMKKIKIREDSVVERGHDQVQNKLHDEKNGVRTRNRSKTESSTGKTFEAKPKKSNSKIEGGGRSAKDTNDPTLKGNGNHVKDRANPSKCNSCISFFECLSKLVKEMIPSVSNHVGSKSASQARRVLKD